MTEASFPRADWNYPTSIRVGPGRCSELPLACRELGLRAPLLVTDPGLAGLPMVERALDSCRGAGLRCDLFSELRGNPTAGHVAAGCERFREGDHDGVIALGGGSALDAGKAIAFHAGQTLPLFDFIDEGDNWTRADSAVIAPVIAVPTTAGTGSEVGRAAIVTNPATRGKCIIFHPSMLPGRVILDAELTLGLPPAITAATGMDALSHNLEALCAPGYHPLAEGIALQGIQLVHDFLPRACARGDDLLARQQMLVASTMGATAFQRGLGAMHALAHPLGGLYDAHHGLLNAVLMPYVLALNLAQAEAPTRAALARVARYLALPGGEAESVLEWVLALRRQIGIPHSLADIGIDDSESARVGSLAALDPSAAGNPVSLDAQAYSRLFGDAVHGRL